MAELTFKSAGVSTREIDLSGPTARSPQGVPAGVIGTSTRGPAFVPLTFATYQDFVAIFGATDGEKFGPLAVYEWMKNANAGAYCKVLGVGNGKKRLGSDGTSSDGSAVQAGGVVNSGFVVGAKQVQANGLIGENPYANPKDGEVNIAATLANILLFHNAVTMADGTEFTITFPVGYAGASGSEVLTIALGNGTTTAKPAAAADQIGTVYPGGTGHVGCITDTDLAKLIALLLAGTNPVGVANESSGVTYAAGDFELALSGIGEDLSDMAARLSAEVGGATNKVSVTAAIKGPQGNSISFADTAGTPKLVVTNGAGGASPTTLAGGTAGNLGQLGRTYFLGAFMSASAGSTFFYDAAINPGNGARGGGIPTRGAYTPYEGSSTVSPGQTVMSTSMPIIRGVLMAPSGVLLSLSCSEAANNRVQLDQRCSGAFGPYTNESDAGLYFGSVRTGNAGQSFTMLLNGHENTGEYPSLLTASFDPNSPNYFAGVFNTDPFKMEQAGHYLYSHYDIYPDYAVVTGSGLTNIESQMGHGTADQVEVAAFMVTSSVDRNTGTADAAALSGVPNFEGFQDRFTHAKSPWITSQDFGGKAHNLFKIHSLDDGNVPSRKVKISIQNIAKSNTTVSNYGIFDLAVRDFYDSDRLPVVLERYSALSLNPSDDRYIGRLIGDMNTYYNFDRNTGNQKLVMDGMFPNRSSYIRVEVASPVAAGNAPAKALPVGYRGPKHLVTSGSAIIDGFELTSATGNAGENIGKNDGGVLYNTDIMRRITQPPIPMRSNISVGKSPRNTVNSALYWGTQFEVNDSLTEPNKTDKFDNSLKSWSKYFPEYASGNTKAWVGDNVDALDLGGTVFDSDRFCNNRFTLERIQVRTQSNDTPDPKFWLAARYRRNGILRSDDVTDLVDTSRFLNVEKDFGSLSARKYLKFNILMQGGYDGLNIFDKKKFDMTNASVKREMDDTLQGGTFGPTVAAYKKAIDVMEEKSDVDIMLLAIPGLRHEAVTDYAIEAMEDRFDAMYIMDIEERDTYNTVVTGSGAQVVNVTNTVSAFSGRSLDSSFGAAYFPDVVVTDPTTRTNVIAPPSVAVLGAYSLNDAVAHPWFAPAGFTRGSLTSVLEAQVKLNRDNLDALYDADINPLASFPGSDGVVVWGQKTLQQIQSALDRVNVRRLLIEIRRKVKQVANRILFEPNREDTLAKFAAAVNPILSRIQQQQGVDRFKVVIDTTTTTQADVENNTIRGKVFLQPTRSVEFVSLDFVVTNAGAEI